MAKNYLYWCSIAAVFILITDLLGVLCLPTKLPQIEGLDPGIVIIEQPNDPIIAIKKSSVLINCSVISSSEHGQVHYFWKKDGIRLNNKEHRSRIEIMRNGSLHIRRVVHKKGKGNLRTHEGFYECFARNNVGSVIGRRVELKVTRIAKEFTQSPASQTVGVGGVVYLACEIEAVPETLYVWQKDNEPLNTNHVRFRQYRNALLITNAQASDVGTYKCFAAIKALLRMDASSSQLRWRSTNEAVVNITQAKTFLPLKIWRKPQPIITVMVNGSTIIDCVVGSQPLPQVTWTWNGKKVPQRAAILSDGSLSLSQISTNMAGNYKCLAKVAGHDDQYTSVGFTELVVEVIAHSFPAITLGPASSAHKIARHNILKCEVTGYPKPQVTWLKNGMVVQPDGRHEILEDTNSFRIFNSGTEDSGYYQCLVENSEGWTSALARLKIDQNVHAPKPPNKIYGEGISGTEILVNWTLDESQKPTDPPLHIVGFSVHYRQVDNTNANELTREVNVLVLFPSQSTKLVHLKPNTDYTIYVKTYNRHGASVDSKSIVVTTLGSVPLSFPSPTIISQGNGDLLIEWETLKESERGGVILGYQIFYGKTSDDHIQVINISGQSNSYLITGLEPGEEYRLRMLAGTEKGFSDFTDGEWPWIYHTVPEKSYRNSIFPTVNITVLNSTTVHFSWKYHGPIELSEQIIFLRNLIQMKVENVINYKPTSRQITLSDLAQDTFHEFILVVKSKSLATGSVSKLFHTSTSKLSQPADTTRPDINIIASLLAPDQITLTWSYPETHQDIILFRVRCQTIFVHNDCERKNISYVKSHTNTAVISNLQPFTWYNISVKAERSDGQGVYSIPTLVLTREGLPSPPEHVQARVVSPDEVALEWSRPARPNGNIKGHYISYSYDYYDRDKWPQIYQEGKMNSTHISNLTQPLYYFRIRACTLAGQGEPSRIIKVFMKHDRRGSLSDQHLGIIGGASIGITCILITVCVIYIKQRQLKKRCIAAQVANSVPCPHGCMIPAALTPAEHLSQHQNHVCKSEELWSLLTPSDKSTVDSPCSSNDTQSTSTATSDLYCHVTSC